MKTFIVGGKYGEIHKSSSIVDKLSSCFENHTTINGGSLNVLEIIQPLLLNQDLILWLPDIDNEELKHYPKKGTGAVLICSKVMREGYRKVDAVSRIFKMQGNAVIAITKLEKVFSFELIDALGNTWYKGDNISDLASSIKKLYVFTKSAKRINSVKSENWLENLELDCASKLDLDQILDLNQTLQYKILEKCGSRFFGNVSTRCQQLFPSVRNKVGAFVSPRNSNKNFLIAEDMVLCSLNNDQVIINNGTKPSVDAPIQLKLYQELPKLNFMIHGHAFCKESGFPFAISYTENYKLCGDFNEAAEILKTMKNIGNPGCGVINLKNHGFLIFAETIAQVRSIIENAEFEMNKDLI